MPISDVSGYLEDLRKGQALLMEKHRAMLAAIDRNAPEAEIAQLKGDVEALNALCGAMLEKMQVRLSEQRTELHGGAPIPKN
jgi:hypothetical protein